jgi:hypothetical protein
MMIFIDLNLFIDNLEFEIYEIEQEQKNIKIKNNIIIPKSFPVGAKFSYIRKNLITLIKKYNVLNAHINLNDNVGIIECIKIEGVVEEALSSCGVEIWR